MMTTVMEELSPVNCVILPVLKSVAYCSQGDVHPERFNSYLKKVNVLIDINNLYV